MIEYNSYRHLLVNMPERQWDSEPELLIETTFLEKTPMFSIVMPIHNQENIINLILNSIIQNTLGYYEIILILDGCIDNTKKNIITHL